MSDRILEEVREVNKRVDKLTAEIQKNIAETKKGRVGMYFIDGKHEENYRRLMALYDLQRGQDGQYEANIYVAAVPEIFKFIDYDAIDTDHGGPLNQLTEWDEEKDELVLASPGLTGTTTRLAEFGLSCYNGSFAVSMDDVLGSVHGDYFNVLVETMKIRKKY